MLTPKTKERKCKCGNVFEQFRSTQNKCVPCLIKYQREKDLKNKHKELKKTVRANDKKTQTRSAREFCHSYIRSRDSKRACISCNEIIVGSGHASHYFDSGQFSAIRYDEQNIHRSCEQCNTHKHGNKTGYRQGLIERYGIEYVNELEAKRDEGRNKKWGAEELIEVKNYYKTKIQQLN